MLPDLLRCRATLRYRIQILMRRIPEGTRREAKKRKRSSMLVSDVDDEDNAPPDKKHIDGHGVNVRQGRQLIGTKICTEYQELSSDGQSMQYMGWFKVKERSLPIIEDKVTLWNMKKKK